MMNAYNPYWWTPQAWRCTQSLPIRGIFKVTTNSVEINSGEGSVDYGVNPSIFPRAYEECIILLTISADVPDGGDDYPVYIVVPGCSLTTLGVSTGTTRVPLLDDTGASVTGADVSENLQKLALLDRQKGVIKFVTA